jgi:hypothetical protein
MKYSPVRLSAQVLSLDLGIHTAVRIDNLGEEFIHQWSPSEFPHERTTR